MGGSGNEYPPCKAKRKNGETCGRPGKFNGFCHLHSSDFQRSRSEARIGKNEGVEILKKKKEIARDLWYKGKDPKEIGEVVGRSSGTIRSWARQDDWDGKRDAPIDAMFTKLREEVSEAAKYLAPKITSHIESLLGIYENILRTGVEIKGRKKGRKYELSVRDLESMAVSFQKLMAVVEGRAAEGAAIVPIQVNVPIYPPGAEDEWRKEFSNKTEEPEPEVPDVLEDPEIEARKNGGEGSDGDPGE